MQSVTSTFFRRNVLHGWGNTTFKLQPCLLRKLANRPGNLKTALCGGEDSASFSDLWEPREGRRRVKRFSSGFYTHICITFISTAVLWNILAHQFLDAVGYARQISYLDKNNRRSYFSASSKYFTTDVSRSRQETRLHGHSESLNQEDKAFACSLFARAIIFHYFLRDLFNRDNLFHLLVKYKYFATQYSRILYLKMRHKW